MKFDMHVKNIRNMKFNVQIFKIYIKKKKKKRYMRSLKSVSSNQFGERLHFYFRKKLQIGLKLSFLIHFVVIYPHVLFKEKIQLQNWLQLQTTILLNKINITIYFENLTVGLHVLYILNTLIKFCVNWILFTI